MGPAPTESQVQKKTRMCMHCNSKYNNNQPSPTSKIWKAFTCTQQPIMMHRKPEQVYKIKTKLPWSRCQPPWTINQVPTTINQVPCQPWHQWIPLPVAAIPVVSMKPGMGPMNEKTKKPRNSYITSDFQLCGRGPLTSKYAWTGSSDYQVSGRGHQTSNCIIDEVVRLPWTGSSDFQICEYKDGVVRLP